MTFRVARRGSIDEQALLQVHEAVRLFGRLRIVRHHDDRLAEVVVQTLEQPEDLFAGGPVEVAGRLVGDDERRIA